MLPCLLEDEEPQESKRPLSNDKREALSPRCLLRPSAGFSLPGNQKKCSSTPIAPPPSWAQVARQVLFRDHSLIGKMSDQVLAILQTEKCPA